MDLNSINIIGRLTKDIELKYMPDGKATCRLWIANNGYKENDVSFIEVAVFGKQAENCNKYISKGSLIGINGYLKQDRWQDKNTQQNNQKIYIIANSIQFLSIKNNQQEKQTSDSIIDDDREIPF